MKAQIFFSGQKFERGGARAFINSVNMMFELLYALSFGSDKRNSVIRQRITIIVSKFVVKHFKLVSDYY